MTVNFIVLDMAMKENPFLFEGLEGSQCKGYDGIVTAKSKIVLCQNEEKKSRRIKKGKKIGTVSLLIREEVKEDEVDDKWSDALIREKVELDETSLNVQQKEEVHGMFMAVEKALSKDDTDIGNAQTNPYKIELTDVTPIWQKARSFAQPVNEEIERQCEELMANDIIEHSDSRWSSPCVPVTKPDSTLRLCIDYRKLNTVTKTENSTMPNVNNCLNRAHKMRYFTKLDLVKGYYQINFFLMGY